MHCLCCAWGVVGCGLLTVSYISTESKYTNRKTKWRDRKREKWIEGCGSCNYSSGPLETFSCISKSSGQIEPMSTTGNLILFAANTHTQKLLDGFSLSHLLLELVARLKVIL